MATLERPTDLAPNVRSLLAQLRARIRRYVWIEGLAAIVLALGLAFWISLCIDWAFEPPAWARRVLLVACGLAAAWIAYRYLLRRAFVRLPDISMAVLLERRFPRLDDALLTAVDLADQPDRLGQFGREMLADTCREAANRSRQVELRQVFNRGPLARMVLAATSIAAATTAFGLANPQAMWIWRERVLEFSDLPWPRQTRLVIEGFAKGEAVVARGGDLDVIVKADTAKVVPQVVQLRYRFDGGDRGRANMNREGDAQPDHDPYQVFKHGFQGILSPITFDVLGGDDRLRNLRVRVVESPAIAEMSLACEFPAYIHRPSRELAVTGAMPVPRGTKVTVLARANKPLLRARVDYAGQESGPQTQTVEVDPSSRDRSRFASSLGQLDEDRLLSFTLFDTDGIHNRQPVQLALIATPDEPPHVAARLSGIGSAITPQARLPMTGTITDDYGVAKAWFEYVIDEGSPGEKPLAENPSGRAEIPVADALDAAEFGLKPGQKLLVGVKASDACDLEAGGMGNVGSGERLLLDVVTPEELRAILEARELNLRQQLEAISSEVTDTRDSLTRLEGNNASTSHNRTISPFASQASLSSDEAPAKPAFDGAEPGDDPADPVANSPERVLARQIVRVERAAQTSQKDAQEVLGVATSFDQIREELINNRVDTEELKIRLKDQIADPLRGVSQALFPQLDKTLAALRSSLSEGKPVDSQRRQALAQLDEILVQMAHARDKMLELESFNEALELLRSIIQEQDKVNEHTKTRRKDKLRELLEPEK